MNIDYKQLRAAGLGALAATLGRDVKDGKLDAGYLLTGVAAGALGYSLLKKKGII